MTELDSIFDALPTSAEIAAYIGDISDKGVRAWRLEGRGIPGKHWPAIVRLARDRKIPGITYDALEAAHDKAAA